MFVRNAVPLRVVSRAHGAKFVKLEGLTKPPGTLLPENEGKAHIDTYEQSD